MNEERERLARDGASWRRWGPYLSERQWGTVREDYSADGDAWSYLSHDEARSRAYRWGEDGIGGWSDDEQRLCLSVALWNGRDPILKERLFGLTNSEANHGEDVKEIYHFVDGLPSHAYMRMVYKYPQSEFPYERLLAENRARSKRDREFEIIDSGVFDDDRYFDVEIEYAKGSPDETVLKVTAYNRGPSESDLWLIPQIWFRNTWSWDGSERPSLTRTSGGIIADDRALGRWMIDVPDDASVVFCENETNVRRLYGQEAPGPFKDGIHDFVVSSDESAVRRDGGTKAALVRRFAIAAGTSVSMTLRLRKSDDERSAENDDALVARRRNEADDFYAGLQSRIDDDDARLVQRQALAGMLWSKQCYIYDVRRWLAGDPAQPKPPDSRRGGRNADWSHFRAADVFSMPDTWEYPWFAAWDLAFHCIPLAMIDPEFAKSQLLLLTDERLMHPNGQLPAYEWAFGDVNPPVHAWSAWRVFQADRRLRGDGGDVVFLERIFIKLLLNFTWWVNRKDRSGRNVFQGGFLGLDNIGVFDRSAPLPTGGWLDQADGTAWMAMYSLNMMRIALELAQHDEGFEEIAMKFFEHALLIVEALDAVGGDGLWDDEDAFFYDWLELPEGGAGRRKIPLRVRSMVGLIPLFAVQVLDGRLLDRLPRFRERMEWFLRERPDLAARVSSYHVANEDDRRLLSIVDEGELRSILRRMLDENEFLSPFGIRALSRVHRDAPFRFDWSGQSYEVAYNPGESDSWLFGGNSNWRGPVWMPVNYLLVESLHKFHHYFGEAFRVECPTGSGREMTLLEVADEIASRLAAIFLRDASGRRAVFAESEKEQDDEHFRDRIPFYEYFDGDTGRGVGASHQTGWTGVIAKLMHPADADESHVAGSGERD